MPTYDFHCNACDEDFTIVLSLKDYEKHKYACPDCKGKDLEQLVTTVGVVTSKKS